MKVRIGIAPPPGDTPHHLAGLAERAEALGIDSLWLSELVQGPAVEPLVGMAYTLAATRKLKVGTGVMILPGRHPLRVAKQLASLAALAPKRVLPAFGLTPARPADREAFPVPGPRGAVFDESLELLRLLLSQEKATFYGEYFTVQDVGIGPLPPKPLDIWVGGSGERALRRAGRLADGWLASFLTPDQAAAGRTAIAAHAAEAGREIEADHYGTSLAVATTEIPATALDAIARRNPGADPAEIVPVGWPAARTMIERFVEAGITKFVVRPATPVPSAERWLDDFATHLMPLQT
ncbi:TIGR03854 family LLM class F420-dependent oxidoreductase [Nonomuraea salmonea]|uniref:TIGR03854 family LLM class F420-dependent oxidoreductase n=1 Tax=Nonomuraea salmonea TaxID=46181 RepID=A0ABV5NCQ0_9ACTN